MSANLRPEDLTSEERALWDRLAIEWWSKKFASGNPTLDAARCLVATRGAAFDLILARRALFAPVEVKCGECGKPGKHYLGLDGTRMVYSCQSSEPKVECPNCRKGVQRSTDHCSMDQGPHGPLAYDCPPAPPEPEKKCPNCRQQGDHTEHTNESGFQWTCQPAKPEPEKVKCPNCLGPVKTVSDHWAEIDPAGGEGFYCEPKADGGRALPEPVEEYTYETDRAIGAQVADAATVEPAARDWRDGTDDGIGATLDFYARRAALAGPPMKRVGAS